MTMTTSWELIMAAHTSWHSSEAASGEKQSKEKNGTSRLLSLPISNPPLHAVGMRQKRPCRVKHNNQPRAVVAPSAEWDEIVYCVVFCAFSMSFLLIPHAGCIYLFSLFLLEVAYAVDDGERCTGIIHPKS